MVFGASQPPGLFGTFQRSPITILQETSTSWGVGLPQDGLIELQATATYIIDQWGVPWIPTNGWLKMAAWKKQTFQDMGWDKRTNVTYVQPSKFPSNLGEKSNLEQQNLCWCFEGFCLHCLGLVLSNDPMPRWWKNEHVVSLGCLESCWTYP